MEKFGSGNNESFNKSRYSSNSFTFPTRNNTTSNMMIYDDVDIDKYMSIVEVELKKLGYSLENRAFIANIINILDKLIDPKKFNKTIFFHILDFANLNRDSPILILDFFRSFFTVYESMKKNREKFAEEILNSTGKIQTTKNKILKFQTEEKVLENGLTNYSSVKIELLISKVETFALNNAPVNNTKPTLYIKFKVGSQIKIIDINSLKRKTSFNVDSMDFIENPLKIYMEVNGREHYIEKINIRDILDQEYFYKFSHQGMTFDLGFLWINSRVNYYNKLVTRLEAKIEENKENINVLNNCISHIEETFKKYFSQLALGINMSTNSSAVSLNVTGFKSAGTMEKELQISQSIEDYVLKIVGKEVFVMDKILFLFNKILFLLLIFVFLQRHDTVTLLSCVGLIGIEFRFIRKMHLYKILISFIISIFLDIIWIFYNLSLEGQADYNDGTSIGSGIRQFAIIMNICLLILKLIVTFCLWRVALENRLLAINRQVKFTKKEKIPEFDLSPKESDIRKSIVKQMRPVLRASVLATADLGSSKIPVRQTDEQL